jgi:predicted ATPase
MVLQAISLSHGKANPYMPVLDLLHSYFGIDPDDETGRRREKARGKVLTLDSKLGEALPYLFGLLGLIVDDDPLAGMEAQIRRRRTHEAVKKILPRESLNQPLILIFEDLQWMDEETEAFLNVLVEGIVNARVLLLVSYRPEFTHPWGTKTYYAQLRLDPLETDSADEMLCALLGNASELASLKRLVLERTQGNPLFIEELVEALFETSGQDTLYGSRDLQLAERSCHLDRAVSDQQARTPVVAHVLRARLSPDAGGYPCQRFAASLARSSA